MRDTKEIRGKNFFDKANNKHKNKYDYSKSTYENMESHIIITCPIHGEFKQTPLGHITGQGCTQCGHIFHAKNITMSQEDFIKKSKSKFDDKYSYDKLVYSGIENGKIIITCNIHGDFKIRSDHHLKNNGGCRKCAGTYQHTQEEFLERCKTIHNSFYDYSLVDFKGSKIKIKIICPKHGIFKQIPPYHLMGGGCPKCNSSKGEKDIMLYLDKNNINYIQEYKFNNCLSNKGYKLKFDFFLSDYNICVEYDGIQHFKLIDNWGIKSFNLTRENDKIKNRYCLDNNIGLLRIKYSDKNKIEKILSDYLKTRVT